MQGPRIEDIMEAAMDEEDACRNECYSVGRGGEQMESCVEACLEGEVIVTPVLQGVVILSADNQPQFGTLMSNDSIVPENPSDYAPYPDDGGPLEDSGGEQDGLEELGVYQVPVYLKVLGHSFNNAQASAMQIIDERMDQQDVIEPGYVIEVHVGSTDEVIYGGPYVPEDDDPYCVCGVYRSEHSAMGCKEGFQTAQSWESEKQFIGTLDDEQFERIYGEG